VCVGGLVERAAGEAVGASRSGPWSSMVFRIVGVGSVVVVVCIGAMMTRRHVYFWAPEA